MDKKHSETAFVRVVAGVYKSNDGYTIRKKVFRNIFTGRNMSEFVWEIYDTNNVKVDSALTLKEAKSLVEFIRNKEV